MTMTSQIYDQSPGKILNALAKTLDAKIEEQLNQCILKIPENFGKGKIRLINFSHGVSVITLEMELKKEIDLKYNDGLVHPLKILLVKEGSIKHTLEKGHKITTVNCFESIIIASTQDNNHYFKIPRNKKISFLSIQINRKKFEPKIEDFIPYMHKDLSKIFRDVNGIQEFNYKNFYTPEALHLVDDILNNKEKDVIESVYLEGQTYQLMMIQLKHYLVNLKSPKPVNGIASKTRLKLKQATDIIENDIANYTTVKDLAKRLQINEKTLQSAFKQFFNVTVNTYVRNFRAHQARMYIETTDLSVSEITYKLGLNSPNHLSKLFKMYYGCSPSEHKRKTKDVKIK